MENLNSSVRIVEVCRVAPQPSSPDSPDHYSLSPTFFDLVWLRFPTVQRLFFYETCSTESVLARLKTSLSFTLQHFLPVAGNLIWPQDSIKPILCYVKGDTVSVTIAESEAADFHRLSSDEFLDVKEYYALVPQLEASHHRAAAMGLQITIFPNSGFSVGTVTNHVVMDGKTLVSFVKSWVHICKQIGFGGSNVTTISLPDQLKPLFDRDDVISDQAGLGESYSKHFLDVHGPNNRDVMPAQSLTPTNDPKLLEETADQLIRCTFEFTRAKIQILRERVMKKTTTISSSKSVHLSTFSLAVAYTWVCLVKAEEIKGGGKTGFVLPVDARTRLEPPVPATYFGNCVTCRVAEAETNDLIGDDGLAVAVSAISDAIKSLEQGVLNGAEYWVSNFIDFRVYDRIYSVAGSQRFEVYEIDFGWGRPTKTSVVSIDRTGAISVSDSKNGGGSIEVGVVLKKQQMEVLATFICKY